MGEQENEKRESKVSAEPIQLRPYQVEGVKWLQNHPYKLLADDMGLGKTPQSIIAMNELGCKTAVIICPASTKIMWARRIAQWGVSLGNVFIVEGGKAEIPPWADVIILNYDLLAKKRIRDQLRARGKVQGYDVVLFDEARALKTVNTKRTRASLDRHSFSRYAKRVFLLDGTPVPNRPIELYPVLSVFAPEVIAPYNSYRAYGEYFCNGKESIFGFVAKGASNIEELSQRLKNSKFFLRRTKEEVMDDLPEKVQTYIEIKLDLDCDTSNTHVATLRREIGLAKVDSTTEYIEDNIEKIGKAVVFCYHTDVIKRLSSNLAECQPVIVQGGQSANEKQEAIDRFISDEQCRVLIGQVIAGGSGIDGLQTVCNHVIFAEIDWSPAAEDQAFDRINRIGQKESTVFVHYMVAQGTLDERIIKTQDKKRDVIETLFKKERKEKQMAQVKSEYSVDENLCRIATALEGIESCLNQMVHNGGIQKQKEVEEKPKKPTGRGRSKPKEEKPEAKEEVKTIEQEDIAKAVGAFLAGTSGEAKKQGILLIREKILEPKFGVSQSKELPQEKRQAFLDELAKGLDSFKDDDVDESDV